jgi:hypothetical protein
MSYEILLKYHESNNDGGYNKDEVKEKKIKIGKPFDDIPLEEVASRVIAQLARRSIFVADVEIYEYYKKKITYKELDDGIKIKGRKFGFNGTVTFTECEDDEDKELSEVLKNNPILAKQIAEIQNNKILPVPKTQPSFKVAIREEVFDPVVQIPAGSIGCMGKDWKFTKGKRYKIYEEKPAGNNVMFGLLYVTTDDAGIRREISDKYFVAPIRLTENFIDDGSENMGNEPKLSFDDVADVPMPKLR